VDINGDGVTDIVSGDSAGNVWLFENVGTRTAPRLASGKRVEADGKPITASRKTWKRVDGRYVVDKVIPGSHELAQIYSKIHVADWNGDGVLDLLVGHDSTVIFYENAGTRRAPRFKAPVPVNVPEGRFPTRPSPYVVDWDGDGRRDLLVGTERSEVFFHRNTGTNTSPRLAEGKKMELKGPGFELGYRGRIDVVDWNDDGKLDILVGNRCRSSERGKRSGGNIWLFLGK
jgi:hypothetical protein